MSNKKIFLVVTVLVIVLVGAGAWVFKNKKTAPVTSVTESDSLSVKTTQEIKLLDPIDQVLIQTSEGVKRVQLSTGEVSLATPIEQDDFSGFVGFPEFRDDGKQLTQQEIVLTSQDKTKALVTVATYDSTKFTSDGEGPVAALATEDFLCDIAQKKCEKSSLLSQEYQGAAVGSQDANVSVWWSAWDSAKNLLFGHLIGEEVGNVSPVFVCDTQTGNCNETIGYDSSKKGDIAAIVPEGASSPSLQKFVMVNQYDKPNETTGTRWELLLYASDKLEKPAATIDISEAISKNENVSYDGIYSVAWSGDEKKLAIATTQKIFMLDLESKKLQLVYDAPFDEEGNLSFDGSELFLSRDGKFIVFNDSEDIIGDGPVDEEAVEVVNVLKKIDLTKNNEVSELLRGLNLGLKL